MSNRFFLDTNLFVYSFNPSAPSMLSAESCTARTYSISKSSEHYRR